jgi:SAM-dependent methyltransferase
LPRLTAQTADARPEQPWQLTMFARSLKKQLKLAAMLDVLGDVSKRDCLLVTCGDNNGALNWHFRAAGGHWTWADLMDENLAEMSTLLGEAVHHAKGGELPFADSQFDCIASIDVLEHVTSDQAILNEMRRVLRPGGRVVVTVPNGDPRLLANRIKWRLGMTPEVYGHTRAGYTVAELRASLERADFAPTGASGYSGFFTEMMELMVNFGYVFVLARKQGMDRPDHIAPASARELKTHGAAYRQYSLVYPVLRLVSQIDTRLPAMPHHAVIVAANRGEAG